mmetsp:Transcript_23460/g.47949  ORF Transcript_23460/g.47949 Transcript_23460/m.47949 type:complete len:88 (-) Transcript_23460:56-319(-)
MALCTWGGMASSAALNTFGYEGRKGSGRVHGRARTEENSTSKGDGRCLSRDFLHARSCELGGVWAPGFLGRLGRLSIKGVVWCRWKY